MRGIIAVDIGTSSLRAILYGETAQVLHMEQRACGPDFHPDGRVEQDASLWQILLPEILGACAAAGRARGVDPLCVAVTSLRSAVVPVDDAGRPLHPTIMWQDQRTTELARELQPNDPAVYRRTGLKISPVFSALKMTWLRRHCPDLWPRIHKLIGVQDLILFLLTGRFVTDETFGSRTNLMDLESRHWDPELLELFEVEPRMLCELVAPGSIVGGLTAAMAAATRLPSGLPVVTAGGDQQCAALGLGLFSSERVVSNTGTGSYLIGHAERPVLDAGMRLACNVSAVPGACIVEAAVLTSGTIYRWFRDTCFEAGASFEALNAEAAGVPAGANGLLLLPHFKGSGAPHWDAEAKGLFYNLALSTTRGELVRAILEGIAIEMKESLDLVEGLCGKAHSVSVSGGLTKSDLFNRIQSDVFDRAIVRYGSSEATSLGAWIAGAVATGLARDHPQAFALARRSDSALTYPPDPENHGLYERQRQRSRALYKALAAPEIRELFR